ncbi:MAG: hypothetical protein QXO20_07660 [Candidatus Bathyarchaeia archaeon]
MKVSRLIGLAILGAAGYAAYVYFTDRSRFYKFIGIDPCSQVTCPPGQHCEGGTCVPDNYIPTPTDGYYVSDQVAPPPLPPTPPPPPPPTPPPPPRLPGEPRCGEGELYDPAKKTCVKLPVPGTGHCAEICAKFPFSSDADVANYIDQWVHGTGPNDAEIALILDCWVKKGKC